MPFSWMLRPRSSCTEPSKQRQESSPPISRQDASIILLFPQPVYVLIMLAVLRICGVSRPRPAPG